MALLSDPRIESIFRALKCEQACLLILSIVSCQLTSAHQARETIAISNNTASVKQDFEGCQAMKSPEVAPKLDDIAVNIFIKPKLILHCKYYVQTNTTLSANAEIQDVKFKNVSLEYKWTVKNRTIPSGPNASEITWGFREPDENQFLSVLVLNHANNETGSNRKELVVRDPVRVLDPKGKLFLEHGELLDIKLVFSSGSNPIKYCYRLCRDEKVNGNTNSCDCNPNETATGNQVSILYYLRHVGNYTLKFVADNIASRVEKSYAVKIAETIRPRAVPFIPIISSILAVVIVLSGLALHLKLKRTLITETADFDFLKNDYNEEEDFWDNEEFTFIQRVRYLFFKEDRDNDTSVNDSILSGTGY